MILLLVLLMMKEHDYFPEIYDERIKYFCDDYDSQGLGKCSWKFINSALQFSTT